MSRAVVAHRVGTLLTMAIVLGRPAPAAACGSFRLVDPELGQTIDVRSASVRIPRDPADVLLLRLEGDRPENLRAIDRGRPLLWFEGATLKLRGRVVGGLVAARLRIGAVENVVEVGPVTEPGPPARRSLAVSRGGKTIMSRVAALATRRPRRSGTPLPATQRTVAADPTSRAGS